jgi:MFS family permease
MMITTMRSSIVAEIKMTDAQFGLLTSVFLWVYGFLSPLAGFIADKFNKSRIVIISLLMWSASTFLTAYATNFEYLLVIRALVGFSEAFYIPAALTLIMDYHHDTTRSLANSVHMMGIMTGQSLGFIGGWLAETHSWNYAFNILGSIGMVYALLLIFGLKDNKASKQTVVAAEKAALADKADFFIVMKYLMTNKNYLNILATWSMLGIVGWVIGGWLPTFYKEKFHLSQTMAGVYATGYFYFTSIIGVLTGGFLADRWSRTNSYARIVLPMIGLCVASPAIFIAGFSAVLPVVVVCFMLYAFTRIFTDANMMPILCMIVDHKHRASAYGVLNLFGTVIGGIGIYAGGYLRDINIDFRLLFKIAALILIVGLLSLYLLKKSVEKNNNKNRATA